MTEGIQGIESLFRRVRKLATDTRRPERALRAAGTLMLGSIEKNFKAQGRPDKWEKLADSTLARRRKGRGRGKSQILIDKGILKNSPAMKVTTAGVAVGTNAVQAKRQHFGFPEGEGRGHAKTPARPFVMFQEEDIRDIGEIFKRHIAGR